MMTFQVDAEKTEHLNIPELQVIVYDEDDSSIYHAIKKPCEVVCPECRGRTYRQRGYKVRKIRDIVLGDGAPMHVTIVYHQREYVCSSPECGITFTDECDFAGQGRKITSRYERYLFELAKIKPISAVASEEGLSKETVSRIFNTYHSPCLFWWQAELKCPKTLGIFSFFIDKVRYTALCNFEDLTLITLFTGESIQEFFQDESDVAVLKAIMNKGVDRVIIEPDCPYLNKIRAALPKARIAVNATSLGVLLDQHLFDLARTSMSRYKYLKLRDILKKSEEEWSQYDFNFLQRAKSGNNLLEAAFDVRRTYQYLSDKKNYEARETGPMRLKHYLSDNKLVVDEIIDMTEIAFESLGYAGIGRYSALLNRIAELAKETHGCKTAALYERILITGKTRYIQADNEVYIPTGRRSSGYMEYVGRDLSDVVQTLEHYNRVYSGDDFIHQLP